MVKKIIISVALILIAIALIFILSKMPSPLITDNQENGLEKIEIDPNIPGMTLPLSNTPKDIAWAVFQKYLAYNKSRDLEGVKSVVYKIASVCEDLKTRVDCEARMGAAYMYGSALRKEDFTNVWSDEEQIILSTDFWLESSKDLDQYGRFRSIIFFVKGTENNWKLLSFSPTKGGATNKGSASQEEVDTRLIRYTEDGDEDGRFDYDEECLAVKEGETCTKTNTKIRDTDGDDWWDGVEALF